MDDPRGRFWERLVADTVGVVVLGFVVQGLWFAAGAALTGRWPDLEPGFRRTSERFLALWVLAVVVGVAWGARRAWAVRSADRSR